MYHKHSFYDTDLHLIIDPISRNITNTSQKTVLMQNDHNSERFTFEIPRYVEGHDMTLCNVVEIHYINIDASNKNNRSNDIYPVDDVQLSPESNDVVIGSWLVSHNATAFNGSLNFIVRFACVSDENVGEIQYQWFSNVYTGLVVSKGIYNTEVVTNDDDSDVLYAWKKEVYEHIEPLVVSAETSAKIASESAKNALESEENSKISETNAKESEENAKESEINAKNSENIALTKADESLVNANLSKSYAVGGTGTRDGEDSDNSKFYSEQAGSITSNALDNLKEVGNAIEEFEKKLTNSTFTVNTETGNLEYEDPNHTFTVNEQTGNLEWEVA